MIWIIGGTSETRGLIRELEGKKEFVISVATYSGAEMLECDNVIVGRMDQQGMLQFIKQKRISIVVDMSHPYAVEVTKNAREACSQANIEYIRYTRQNADSKNCVYIDSIDACAAYLAKLQGCIFFTTGIKNIKDFEKVRGENRFVYRVLPTLFSIQECLDNKLKMEDIVAILGPVSEDLNYAMFKDFHADYVVMKDSGKEGGTEEKINACKRLGITPVVIGRQEDHGIEDLDSLVEMIL